ncbi:T9SS type A sorting domain-containing protein [Niastella caeni]|uniref:T9SS type A sorting domain-containing protein n=1 Tax=Niastella caeni TaxID=2569763 RepID=A0A4V4H0Y0_9BACT|nr:T9SS type A sorting domain-containing protein [Niastella caeni]THU38336.1 T9SS type A sorting domain-containing protein [Niastella caeni]
MRLICIYLVFIAMLVTIQASAQQWNFAARHGGSSTGFSDAVNAMCTDASGNVYVTGNFNGTINFGNGTATLAATAGGTQTEGFVAKFNSAGLCQWAIDFGGAASDAGGLGIVTDGATVYVTGQSQFPSVIGTLGLGSVGGSTDGVVFALSAATGSTLWASAFGGDRTGDRGQAICMDNAGHLYISGIFSTRTANPTAYFGASGAFPRTVQGNISSATSDLFVAQLNAVTGAFNWVSTGGAASQETPLIVGNDNVSGSGIAFLPGQNELVITGSYANATASYYSNGSGSPSLILPNAGEADICLLRMNLAGNFLSGLFAGGANADEALAVSYDANTSAVYFNGYFNSASVSGSFSLTNTAGGFDEVYYARYNPGTHTIAWVKSASGSAGGNDFAFANDAGATGVYVTGRFQGSISFPTAATPLTATAVGFDDVFLVKVDAATGNATQLASAGSTTSGTDAGMDVVVSTNNNVWVGGIFAGGTLSFTPSSPSISVTAGTDLELYIARYNDPPPVITTHPSASTACLELPSVFTVAATGNSLTYQWQESTNASFTSPTTLTNTGIYSGVTTATLTIANNTTVNGRYYRARVSNSGGTVYSNGALLNATIPTLPATHTSQAQLVNTFNNLYYASSCRLISKVAPSGASPIMGTVTSEVWVESTVPTVNGKPFVQRHYQITPAVNPFTATAAVTLYFSQAEFDAFNAAPGSTGDLPTGPTDNAGKARLRIEKYSGSSNNGTGLPGSYTSYSMIINPPDANITWNATTALWQITLDVTGFSGFIVHTNPWVLPVTLQSFAAGISGADVSVQWKTSNEWQHDHFEVERSTDGRHFTSVAIIEPLTGSGDKSYAHRDAGAALLNTAKLYYRLKMVSTSGTVEYSNIIIVNLTPPSTPITRVGPNPFHHTLEVGLYMQENSRLILQLTDLYGRVVVQETGQAPKGFSTYTINQPLPLTPGVYVLTVNVGGQLYSFKLQKQ